MIDRRLLLGVGIVASVVLVVLLTREGPPENPINDEFSAEISIRDGDIRRLEERIEALDSRIDALEGRLDAVLDAACTLVSPSVEGMTVEACRLLLTPLRSN